MVGVPGRSKGCNTCRRRKKGCDQKRPRCGQCIKAGIPCAGYERAHIFVHAATNAPAAADKTNSRQGVAAIYQPVTAATLPESLVRSAFESGHLAHFCSVYLPVSSAPSSTLNKLGMRDWMDVAQELCWTSTGLKKALLAFTLTTMGSKDEQQEWMRREGIKLHVEAVAELTRSLQSSRRDKGDQLLATSRLISLFEVLHGAQSIDGSAQSRSWQGLVRGEMILLMERGPETYMTGQAHRLFVEARRNMAIAAISARKTSAFNTPEWKTIPWTFTPKSAKEELIDIMLDIPIIEEYYDFYRACTDPVHKEFIRLKTVEQCWKIEHELTDWIATRSPVQVSEGWDNLIIPEDSNEWESVALADLMNLCWGCCILTYLALRLVSTPEETELLPARTDPRRYCRAVAAIIPYFSAPTAGVCASHLPLFGIHIAMAYLANADRDHPSAEQQVLKNFGKNSKFLRSLADGDENVPLMKGLKGMKPLAVEAA